MQASPIPRSPLLPATNNSLNTKAAPSRKRKRNEEELASNDGLNIAGKSYFPDFSPQAVNFSPIVTVPRAELPLIWLDAAHDANALPADYLFETKGTVLQILAPKQIMIARLRPNGALYALEKVKDSVYSASRLRVWVTEDNCRSAAVGEHTTATLDTLQSIREDNGGHRRNASITSTSSSNLAKASEPKQPKNRKGAMARRSILSPKDLPEQVQTTTTDLTSEEPTEIPAEIVTDHPLNDVHKTTGTTCVQYQDVEQVSYAAPEQIEQPSTTAADLEPVSIDSTATTQGPADEARCQYLDTLYARTSLAFYAKGALTRARGLAQNNVETTVDRDELQETYMSLVLPSKKLDTKYKESVPVFLKHLSRPADETPKAKRRTSKKVKLGKDCLYTGEYELLQTWWEDRAVVPTSANFETQVKRHAEELRNREAEMQLLLILEIMIAESASQQSKPNGAIVDPDIKVESVENEMPDENRKKRKQRDFSVELDGLLDRLCIWHTVTIDDFLVSPEKQSDGSDSMFQRSKDKLKDFCADIIMPFYASKLPKEVKHICKKLGGPTISPQRPQGRPKSSLDHRRTTMNPTKSSVTNKSSLQRVLSLDQELRHSSPPILSRSSSGHQRSNSTFKREPSEMMSRPSSRAGMSKSVSFSNREIDLDADAKIQETKRRKLEKVTSQKKELAAAIEALKKPNRSSAGRSIVEEAQRRSEAKLQVHITATPRKGKANAFHIPGLQQPAPEPEQMIPSSTLKPSSLTNTLPRPSAKKRAVLSAIHDTPSRDVEHRKSNPLNLSLPPSVIAATPSTNRFRPDLASSPFTQQTAARTNRPVLFTPLKRTEVSIEDAFRDAPEIPEQAGKAMDRVMGGKARGLGELVAPAAIEVDLYKQLGWDDDGFDD